MKYFSENEKLSMHSFFEVLTVSKLNNSFPIVEIVLRLFIFISCPNSGGKGSFSVLKRVKYYQKI
jgi:hypothetical protein